MRAHGPIVLRDWRPEDLDAYVAWMTPGHAWQRSNAPYLPHPAIDPEQVERMRQRIADGEWDTPRSRLIVADASTGEMIGSVTRYWESVETDWLSIGVVLYDSRVWGRGRGTASIARWTDYLFAEMPHLVRLGMRTWSGNPGMMRVAERLGFQEEARFRKARIVDGVYYDSVGYGVLREEWSARWADHWTREVPLSLGAVTPAPQ